MESVKLENYYLSAKIVPAETLDEFERYVMKNMYGNVAVLRPGGDEDMLLSVEVYDNARLSGSMGSIDMGTEDDWKYFSGLLIGNSDPDMPTSGPVFSDTTQWIYPFQIDQAIKEYGGTGFAGYGAQFANSPVNIDLYQWLEDRGASLSLSCAYYLKYQWYSKDDDGNSHSDDFSVMVPSFSPVGALAGNSVSRNEFENLTQKVQTQVRKSSSEQFGTFDIVYRANPWQCTIVDYDGNEDFYIMLEDYEQGKVYKVQLVANRNLVLGQDVFFITNEGVVDEFNQGIEFEEGKTYLLQVNLGFVQIMASKESES